MGFDPLSAEGLRKSWRTPANLFRPWVLAPPRRIPGRVPGQHRSSASVTGSRQTGCDLEAKRAGSEYGRDERFSLPIWWNFPEEDFWGTPRRQPPVRVAVQSADESRSELHRPTTYDSFIL